jgi:hypothetical protein
MNTEDRIRAYGGNPWALTAPQRRRAAKNDRRSKQRAAAYVIVREFPGGCDAAPLDNRSEQR